MRAALALALWEVRQHLAPVLWLTRSTRHPFTFKDSIHVTEERAYRHNWRACFLPQIGKRGEAETQWGRVDDIRYKDANWLKSQRHWPPRCLLTTMTAVQMQMQLQAANVLRVPRTSEACISLPASGELVALSSRVHSSSILVASVWQVDAGYCRSAWHVIFCIAHMCRLLKDLEAFKAIRAV